MKNSSILFNLSSHFVFNIDSFRWCKEYVTRHWLMCRVLLFTRIHHNRFFRTQTHKKAFEVTKNSKQYPDSQLLQWFIFLRFSLIFLSASLPHFVSSYAWTQVSDFTKMILSRPSCSTLWTKRHVRLSKWDFSLVLSSLPSYIRHESFFL